jgi:hypothetical protein
MSKEWIEPRTKIDAICGDNSTRYALGYVNLVPTKIDVIAVATDGRGLTIVPVNGKMESQSLLPSGLISETEFRKATKNGTRWEVSALVPGITPLVFTSVEQGDGKFPDAPTYMPVDAPVCGVCLDAGLLARIASAVNDADCKQVAILIAGPDKPLVIVGNVGVGVLMQCVDTGQTVDTRWQQYLSLRGRLEAEKSTEAARRAMEALGFTEAANV